ncbi:hypothetical protein AX17_001597 [Amanita inopinata Kibby_2008]|nr:hypothetical protein AX17_001597 [Amanita inopinata Kibby_2008]
MQDPVREIKSVVEQLTAADSPDVQKAAVYKYYTPDAGFRHPLSQVDPGPLSRESILGIYQWYRIISPNVSIHLDNIVYDEPHSVLLLDVIQKFHLFFLPMDPAPSRLLVRLTLKEDNGMYLIAMQEDFFHPEDIAALVLPPMIPLVRFTLQAAGVASNILAKTSQVLGYWRPSTTGISREQIHHVKGSKISKENQANGRKHATEEHDKGQSSISSQEGKHERGDDISGHEGSTPIKQSGSHGKQKVVGKRVKSPTMPTILSNVDQPRFAGNNPTDRGGGNEPKYNYGQNPYEALAR